MGEVIQFGGNQPKPDAAWKFTMDFYVSDEGQWTAEVVGFHPDPMSPGDRLRMFADALHQIEHKARNKAENLEPSTQGQIVASATVYQDATIRLWTDTDIDKDWISERLEEAKGALWE